MLFVFIGIIALRIFSFWLFFENNTLSAGDWPYLYLENIKEFSWWPQPNYLWLAPYYQVLTKIVVQYLGISWVITEKILWFLPFILLSLFSSYKLTKSALGALIYTTNTYILMIVGGGQLGIALSYSLAPLVLKQLIDFKDNLSSIKIFNYVTAGIILAIQIMFDPRIALLTLFISILYYIFHGIKRRKLLQDLGFPVGIATLLNLYWLIPLFRSELPVSQQIGEATIEAVKYFSFATFEQTLSLTHPNWPENIFGKVYFMRPEFLVITILAFSALIIKPQSRKILFFASLALIGAFLGKGTNQPFGEVYLWMFEHVPGFKFFRDPTKFYLFTAISFSVLIPFTINQLKPKKFFSVLFILFWAFTIREAIFGQLTGTFKPASVPTEYIKLKDYLIADQQNDQTLWIPERQRFGFASKLHPSIDAKLMSGQSSVSGILTWISKASTQVELNLKNIKYVIVPYDSRGELFLTDRKYDETIYKDVLNHMINSSWLKKRPEFNQIGVFEIK